MKIIILICLVFLFFACQTIPGTQDAVIKGGIIGAISGISGAGNAVAETLGEGGEIEEN